MVSPEFIHALFVATKQAEKKDVTHRFRRPASGRNPGTKEPGSGSVSTQRHREQQRTQRRRRESVHGLHGLKEMERDKDFTRRHKGTKPMV